MNYLVPNYYKDFKCKGHSCKKCCCEGWGISISLDEYLHLVGLNCSKKLRDKLDGAFQITQNPTEKRYATLSPNYLGDCPLHLENGYCALQSEKGEEMIPSICRYYPRMPKKNYIYESAMSNSCEETIELLMKISEPLEFTYCDLDFKFSVINTLMTKEEKEIKENTINIINKGCSSLDDDFKSLIFYLEKLDDDELTMPNQEAMLKIVINVIIYYKNDDTVKEYMNKAIDKLRLNNPSYIIQNYENLVHNIEELFHLEKPIRNILVNHMFIEGFPFKNHMNVYDEGLILLSIKILINLLLISSMETINDFPIIISTLFRLIEHSNYYHNVMSIAYNYDENDYIATKKKKKTK